MSDENAEPQNKGLPEAINDDVTKLIYHLRCSRAPDNVLAEATQHIQEAVAALQPWLQEGDGWSTISVAGDNFDVAWHEDDLTHVMPYSPVSGKRNPVALPIKMWREGDEVEGEVIFSPTYAGPPDSVHGGIIAAVFDEVLAMSNVISGNAGFTGILTIKYHDKTPLNTPITLRGVNVRQDGRKQVSRGEMLVDGQLTASAEGLFISAAKPEEEGDSKQ